MDNNFSESKRNLSRAPQETELGSVPVNQWPSPYKKQVRNLEFQLTSVSRGRVRPPLPDKLISYRYKGPYFDKLISYRNKRPYFAGAGGSDSHHVRRYLLIQQVKTHTFCR